MATVRDYYLLTKPGIIRGNLFTALAGFFLAAQGSIDWARLLYFCAGMVLITAAACVANNVMDRDLDAHMARTKQRALVTGTISVPSAMIYAGLMVIAGSVLLGAGVNVLTLGIGLAGFVSYTLLYTPLKRRTVYAAVIGAIPGAVPPVAGYVAVSNHINGACLLLFGLLFVWQLPHFYAIGLYRKKEYAAARLPIFTVVRSLSTTVATIRLLIIAFICAAVSFAITGYCSWLYTIPVLGSSLLWLVKSFKPVTSTTASNWGKQVFLCSLVVIAVTCSALILDSLF